MEKKESEPDSKTKSSKANKATGSELPKEKEIKKIEDYNLNDFNDAFDFVKIYNSDNASWQAAITHNIKKMAITHNVNDYFWTFLYDDIRSISSRHSNKLYESLKSISGLDIAMLISSSGGSIESAYLISKTCKRKCKDKFIVSIPRKAKSAATLLSLGANEIHMGLMSELGPIDPQIGDFPALSMSNALEKIAEMAAKYPKASDMFASYLNMNLNLRLLGYFERINESAVQYAERLLNGKNEFKSGKTISEISNHLVNHYKDHSFVIDYEEAKSLLGDNIIKEETDEYRFTNDVYQMFDKLKWLMKVLLKMDFAFIGNIENGLELDKIPEDKT